MPVALSGRVWVYCDATRNPIQPGDLLTTSATPGHAMKVTNHTKAQGAIIGKAMTRLKSGRGLVLVLVTYHLGDAAGQGFAHSFSGIVLFVAAVLMMIVAEGVIRRPAQREAAA